MAQKNLGIDEVVAVAFEEFCKRRGMAQGRTVSAAMLHFLELDNDAKEAVLLRFYEWQESDKAIQSGSSASHSARKRRA